ncbi:HRDC domain-containing protein [Egicoccus sp. AB-alg6-2]|uniref:HRDC domain-containing protein n=1 Tax=Egicoccus sp. AB-alg6-2 TaxID=3242692 RepID=UPI00359CD5A4
MSATSPATSDVGRDQALAIHRVTAGAMAERAVALVRDRLDGGAAANQAAVLARVNSALLPVQVALTEAGVGHSAPLDASVLGRTGVRTALAYLRLGLDLDRCQRDDLLDTLNRPARKVKSAVQPHLRRSTRWSIGQLESMADALDPSHRERWTGYLGDLHHLSAAITDGADTARVLWIVRNRIGLGEAMEALDSSRTRPEGSSHGDDLDALEQLAALHPDPATFRDWLVDRLRVPADPDGVVLSTVHRVKGMEWDHVVVFAATAGLFPHRLSEDVEEERRVFHVAVTRGRRRVDVVADRERTSAFVAELHRAGDAVTAPRDAAATLPEHVTARTRPDGAIVAQPGLRIGLPGGLDARVTVVDPAGVAVDVDDDGHPVALRLPYGAAVTVDGRRATLAPAPRTTRPRATANGGVGDLGGRLLGDDEPPMDDTLYEALRQWRTRIAAEQGVPPYLVFHDRHLQVIAGRRPTTLRELAGCPGVGPTKLERYGDDLLDVVASATTP